jgi:Sulfatase
MDMNAIVGSHDILFVTLDTLRYDVAAELHAAGRTPALARFLPPDGWERRHTPASFTYAAHHAFFAGFLPTPPTPGPHRRLFAAGFPGSTTVDEGTWVFEQPDVVSALASHGYHTACVGGVGFFNRRSALGCVLPDLFADAHWEPEFGVTEPDSTRYQVDRIEHLVRTVPPGLLFLFLNVSAIHQPNRYYVAGAAEDSRDTHAAALTYVDGHIERLFTAMAKRGRPWLAIVCSDHGTAYGEDGHTGHRVAQESVWTVPYAHFVVHDA